MAEFEVGVRRGVEDDGDSCARKFIDNDGSSDAREQGSDSEEVTEGTAAPSRHREIRV